MRLGRMVALRKPNGRCGHWTVYKGGVFKPLVKATALDARATVLVDAGRCRAEPCWGVLGLAFCPRPLPPLPPLHGSAIVYTWLDENGAEHDVKRAALFTLALELPLAFECNVAGDAPELHEVLADVRWQLPVLGSRQEPR